MTVSNDSPLSIMFAPPLCSCHPQGRVMFTFSADRRNLRKPKETSPVDYSESQCYTPKHLKDKILTTRSSIEGERKLVFVFFTDVSIFALLNAI